MAELDYGEMARAMDKLRGGRSLGGREPDPVSAAGRKAMYETFVPQSPRDIALMGLGLRSVGPVAKVAGLAIGDLLSGSDAEAGGASRVFDPKFWHGISGVKLPRPINEMRATHVPTGAGAERTITPADLQGGTLIPTISDRSVAGSTLTHVGDTALARPVEMQGGPGFMAANEGQAWAMAKPQASALQNMARRLAEHGQEAYVSPILMGSTAIDASHHMGNTLAGMLPSARITRAGASEFNDYMRAAAPDFPGVRSKSLGDWLNETTMGSRREFARRMDTRASQEAGFPSVAEARFAVTDPRFLDAPAQSSGMAISRIDPAAPLGTARHGTYSTAVPGTYEGGFGANVPFDVMYPQMAKALRDAGYTKPDQLQYVLQGRIPAELPRSQRMNQRWVDSVSQWLEQNAQR